jgi:hypothetical protein
MLPFAGFIFEAAVFYAIIMLVARDSVEGFWWCLLWILGSTFAGLVTKGLLGSMLLHLPEPVAALAGLVVTVGVLAVILWHQGIQMRKVWTIIGLWALAGIIIELLAYGIH